MLRQSWILDSSSKVPDFRYWIPDLIPVVSGIPDSKVQIFQIIKAENYPDSGVRKQKFF